MHHGRFWSLALFEYMHMVAYIGKIGISGAGSCILLHRMLWQTI